MPVLALALTAAASFVVGSAVDIGGRIRVGQPIRGEPAANRSPGLYPTVDQLMGLSDEELGRVDPVVVNLAVARGIPKFANLDVEHYVHAIDAWAREIKHDIERHHCRFEQNPAEFDHSEARYKIDWLISDIYTIFNIDYDVLDIDFSEPSNLFLNGIVDRKLGTCISLPMLHVALGWRLGMPIKPVAVPTHVFARWDDGHERINIEATGYGDTLPDSRYEELYFVSSRAKERRAELASLTPRQTLALLLLARASYWQAVGNQQQRVADALRANILFPAYPLAISELAASWTARGQQDSYFDHAREHLTAASRRIAKRQQANADEPIEKLIFGANGEQTRVQIDPATGRVNRMDE